MTEVKVLNRTAKPMTEVKVLNRTAKPMTEVKVFLYFSHWFGCPV
jgi:hypothetical protein